MLKNDTEHNKKKTRWCFNCTKMQTTWETFSLCLRCVRLHKKLNLLFTNTSTLTYTYYHLIKLTFDAVFLRYGLWCVRCLMYSDCIHSIHSIQVSFVFDCFDNNSTSQFIFKRNQLYLKCKHIKSHDTKCFAFNLFYEQHENEHQISIRRREGVDFVAFKDW